ncbi:internal scaffolding protein [Microviridae sp.]|nr:internal scaffolding protein [Microviridae sp.]
MFKTRKKDWNRKVQTTPTGESMTEQHHLDQVSIHRIMERYRKAGVLDHVQQYQGQYMNVVGATDFKESMDKIIEARELFETVPSRIRADFNNDVTQFIDFMQNNENIEAIEAYGMDASHLVAPQGSESPPEPFIPPRGESTTLPPETPPEAPPEPSQ